MEIKISLDYLSKITVGQSFIEIDKLKLIEVNHVWNKPWIFITMPSVLTILTETNHIKVNL